MKDEWDDGYPAEDPYDDELKPWHRGYAEQQRNRNPRDLFSEEGRAWLREQVRWFGFSRTSDEGPRTLAWAEILPGKPLPQPYSSEMVERFLDRYMARPLERYATWSEEGQHWWCCHREEMIADFAAVRSEVLSAIDAERFPTLDAWLRADVEGQLMDVGPEGGALHVSKEQRAGLRSRREFREFLRPTCRDCGSLFSRKGKNVRCNGCIAIAKGKRPPKPRRPARP